MCYSLFYSFRDTTRNESAPKLMVASSKYKREGFTGLISVKPARMRDRIVKRVCRTLRKSYGEPRLGNPREPLDDLLYVMISNKTSPAMAQQVYARLRSRFSTWEGIVNSPISVVRSILKPAGLSGIIENYII